MPVLESRKRWRFNDVLLGCSRQRRVDSSVAAAAAVENETGRPSASISTVASFDTVATRRRVTIIRFGCLPCPHEHKEKNRNDGHQQNEKSRSESGNLSAAQTTDDGRVHLHAQCQIGPCKSSRIARNCCQFN